MRAADCGPSFSFYSNSEYIAQNASTGLTDRKRNANIGSVSDDPPGGSMSEKRLHELSVEIGAALKAKGWWVTCAESCTGGLIAKAITDIAGSSAWFDRGFVTYSNAAKHRSEEHTSELQSQSNLVCRLLLEKKKNKNKTDTHKL